MPPRKTFRLRRHCTSRMRHEKQDANGVANKGRPLPKSCKKCMKNTKRKRVDMKVGGGEAC